GGGGGPVTLLGRIGVTPARQQNRARSQRAVQAQIHAQMLMYHTYIAQVQAEAQYQHMLMHQNYIAQAQFQAQAQAQAQLAAAALLMQRVQVGVVPPRPPVNLAPEAGAAQAQALPQDTDLVFNMEQFLDDFLR
ncbi:MAG: hypothetical protein WCK49_08760, partial [Myxococcaceae bacterium]